MPDGDIFSRAMARGWRKAARLTDAHADAAMVGRAAISGLVQTLHEAEGCPQLDDVNTVVQDVQRECANAPLLMYDPATMYALLKTANQRLDAVEMQAERHTHTVLAADVARAYILRMLHAAVPDISAEPITDALATELCVRLVQHYHFDAQRPLLMGSRFASYDEARAWESDVLACMAPRIGRIARALVRDTTGRAVKTPRWPREASSTAELLNLPVTLSAGG